MLLYFLLLFAFFEPRITAKVPICNGLRYTGVLNSCETNKTFYSYGFDLGVSVNPNNQTFPNQLRITNYENWSSNSSLYYQYAPLIFKSYGFGIQCPSMNETCLLDFPNGFTELLYPLAQNGKGANLRSNPRPFINNGNIFDGYYGNILSPGVGLGWHSPYCPTKYLSTAVCTNFYYINVPEDNYGSCMDFKSTTKITDPSKNATVTLNADYGIIPIGFNITITSFISSLNGSAYRLGPNIHFWRGVGGNTENPVQNFGLKIGGPNYRIEWTLDISVPGYAYKRIIAGELIRRNGIFYKDDSIPYTVTDPCFKRTFTIPYSNNATAETDFCCTLFATK